MGPEQSSLFPQAPPSLIPGLLYQPSFLAPSEESELLERLRELPFEPARYKGYRARRHTVVYGRHYDFDRGESTPAPPVPPLLHPLRARIAALAQLPAEQFSQALVSEYRPGSPLGWHRDAPAFELIAGVSLRASAELRFRPYPPTRAAPVFSLIVEPRSLYLMRAAARWRWQHSVVAVKALRYSITFRTLRDESSRS